MCRSGSFVGDLIVNDVLVSLSHFVARIAISLIRMVWRGGIQAGLAVWVVGVASIYRMEIDCLVLLFFLLKFETLTL